MLGGASHSVWLRTNEARRRVALLGPPVSRFGIPISAASSGSPHGTGRATRSGWPLSRPQWSGHGPISPRGSPGKPAVCRRHQAGGRALQIGLNPLGNSATLRGPWTACSRNRRPATASRTGSPNPGANFVSTITQPVPLTLPSPGEVYRFTVDQYDRMVRDGTIDEDDPVELLDGIVVRKMPKGPRHDASSAMPARDRAGPPRRLASSGRGLGANPGLQRARTGPLRGPGRERRLHRSPSRPGGYRLGRRGCGQQPVAGSRREARQLCPGRHPRLLDRQPGRPPARGQFQPDRRRHPPATILGETDSADLVIAGQVVGQIAVANLLPRRP